MTTGPQPRRFVPKFPDKLALIKVLRAIHGQAMSREIDEYRAHVDDVEPTGEVMCGGRRGCAPATETAGLFEAVINAIHRAAPQAAIAFNTRPDDSGAAAARWI